MAIVPPFKSTADFHPTVFFRHSFLAFMLDLASLLLVYTALLLADAAITVEAANAQPKSLASNDSQAYLTNNADLGYYVDISLGGQYFHVLIDTGSSDLWVAGHVGNSTDTGHQGSVSYAIGGVNGSIRTADLQFAGFTISNQAYLEIPADDKNIAGTGILGLGPNTGSFIYRTLQTSSGYSVLNNVFYQDTTSPNLFTVLLGRTTDPNEFFSGSITVGDLLPVYSDVESKPKLPMTQVPETQENDQHLQVLLDMDGVIGPDGEPIPFQTGVTGALDKRATAVLDCGFSFPQLPKSVSDAMYSRFYGAEFVDVDKVGGAWIVPCDQEVNVTFKFGSEEYRMHPLDMTIQPSVIGLNDELKNSKGEECCVGTFQPFSYERNVINYDMILGMAFMRNVYTVFDYGDFVTGSTKQKDPYAQMLSITNATEAHLDFVKVRLGGIDTTGSKGLAAGPRSSSPSNPKSRTVRYIVAALCAFVGLLLMIFLIRYLNLRRKRRKVRKVDTGES
ncbi:aspartic peptidase domain-containing protein [Cyathus striatus]|nr:aspartic peptidase domain-containing protein [Cyathus striatus]